MRGVFKFPKFSAVTITFQLNPSKTATLA